MSRGGFGQHGFTTGGRGSFGSGRAGFGAARSGARFGSSFGSGFRGGFGTGFRTGFRRPFPGGGRFGGRRLFYGYRGWSYPAWPYGFAGGFYAGPGYIYPYSSDYADNGYSPDTSYYPAADITYRGYNASYFDQNSQYQQGEIDRLENEVTQLRARRQAAQDATRASAAASSEAAPKTTLVFADQHSEEISNYAVIGQTLWIFSEERARKIPLAALDIPATQKANDENGIDFRVPE
jgi:hypothetical protein